MDADAAGRQRSSGGATTRLPLVGDESASVGELYAWIRAERGAVINLYRTLANQPAALGAFLDMSRYVRERSPLSPRLRELAVLQTAAELPEPYERAHHEQPARRAGVTDEQMRELSRWRSSPAFDARERAVLAYAAETATARHVSDATFRELRAHLSVPEVVDLAVVVAWYHLCAALVGPLRIPLERPEDAGADPPD
jgi:alkylhydroperoxidase family enzyme